MVNKDNENKIDLDYLLKNLNIHKSKNEKEWAKSAESHFKNFYKMVKKQPISSFLRAMEVKCRELHPVFPESFMILVETSKSEAKDGWCVFSKEAKEFVIFLPKSKYKKKESEKRDIVAHEFGHLYSTLVSLEKKYEKDDFTKKEKECRDFLYNNLEAKREEEPFNNRADIIRVFVLNQRAMCYNKRTKEPKNKKFLCKTFKEYANDVKKVKLDITK